MHPHVAQSVLQHLVGRDLVLEPHHVEVAVGRLAEGDVQADSVLAEVRPRLGRRLAPSVGASPACRLPLGLVVQHRKLDPWPWRPERLQIGREVVGV